MTDQKQPSLPSNIDSEVLELITSTQTLMSDISKGWKTLAATVNEQAKTISEQEATIIKLEAKSAVKKGK